MPRRSTFCRACRARGTSGHWWPGPPAAVVARNPHDSGHDADGMTAVASARRTTDRVEYKWIVATVFVCGMFIDILDTTIVNVALPDLAREFHASTSSIEWIVLGYLLSLAVCIPASGWIGDRFGTRRVFLFALAMFTFASALCGQSHS